ncbi:hypothetical protein M0R45_030962 [Rubus argutus]|uniref:Uncharacterized protein n=1 Tax=Rubus argutus TaxID=59490 RepID=A0AAW1WGW8_RUBAR
MIPKSPRQDRRWSSSDAAPPLLCYDPNPNPCSILMPPSWTQARTILPGRRFSLPSSTTPPSPFAAGHHGAGPQEMKRSR